MRFNYLLDQDTPTVSPQMYSPMPTETSASSEQNTVEQATEHVMDVRREAEDSNQVAIEGML